MGLTSRDKRDAYYRLVETMMPLEGDAIPKAEMAERLRAVLIDEVLKPLMENGLPMEKYVISKSLKRRYKSDTVTQKRLADKIVARIERTNDRPWFGELALWQARAPRSRDLA